MRGFVVSAAVVAAVGLLVGCGRDSDSGGDAKAGSSSVKADAAACERAVTEQVKKSVGGDKAAKDDDMPASCEGLDEETKKKIAEKAAAAAVADVLGAAGGEVESSDAPDAKGDVKIVGCAKDEFGYPVAKLEVVNSASAKSDMNVQVAFNGPDGTRLAEGGTIVSALDPGQKAHEDAMGLKTIDGKFTCKVSNVDRWPSS